MRKKLIEMKRYLPGITLILLALMIVALPMLLVVLVSSLLLFAGITALVIAHRLKKVDEEYELFFSPEPFEFPFWDNTAKVFVHRILF